MTDKQMIIDDVDVSKCNYFNNTDKSYCEECCSEFGCAICNDRPNCYYKQLKRKENELEELRQYHNKCCEEFKKEKQDLIDKYNQLSINFYNGDYCNTEHCSLLKAKEYHQKECEELKKERDTLSATRNKLLDDLWVVEENLKDYTEHFNKASDELDQLKAENDKLKSELHSKVEFIQEQRNIIDEYSKEIRMYKKCQGNRASKREEKLKHALAEIKEIAEDFYLDGEHVKDKYLAQEILQKISEYEVGND